jgi:hypothetical protein
VIALCTLRCGGESFNDREDFGHSQLDWFKFFLTLRHGIPSPDTFNRVFAALDLGTFTGAYPLTNQNPRALVLCIIPYFE